MSGFGLLVAVATVLTFGLGAAYYAVLGRQLAALSPAAAAGAAPSPVTLVVEVFRGLVLATVVVALASATGIASAPAGLALGFGLWVGFPLVLWVGAVVHEKTPWRLAALHAGDWLVKLIALGVLVGLWP